MSPSTVTPEQLLHTNQASWKRARTLTNALIMEQDYGCDLSPYAKVLLGNLLKLVTKQIELNTGIKQL